MNFEKSVEKSVSEERFEKERRRRPEVGTLS